MIDFGMWLNQLHNRDVECLRNAVLRGDYNRIKRDIRETLSGPNYRHMPQRLEYLKEKIKELQGEGWIIVSLAQVAYGNAWLNLSAVNDNYLKNLHCSNYRKQCYPILLYLLPKS